MGQKITYYYEDDKGYSKNSVLMWNIDEDFSEIRSMFPYKLTEMTAEYLSKNLKSLSLTSLLLLSAVAGAVWQKIADLGSKVVNYEELYFIVEPPR